MRLIILLLALLLNDRLYAAIDIWQLNSLEKEQQYRELVKQLRCPKCQNNSIADSNAIIAADMRTKVYELTQQGKNRKQIIDYMVDRYGNFVTYQPPVTPVTLILWVGPALFLLVGATVIIKRAQRRLGIQSVFSQQERQRLARLLEANVPEQQTPEKTQPENNTILQNIIRK